MLEVGHPEKGQVKKHPPEVNAVFSEIKIHQQTTQHSFRTEVSVSKIKRDHSVLSTIKLPTQRNVRASWMTHEEVKI